MENASGGSLDLLSAALNQSGLMDGDILSSLSDGITIGSGMVSGHSEDPLLEALTIKSDNIESGSLRNFLDTSTSVTCTPLVTSARLVTVVSSTVASKPEAPVITTTPKVSLQTVKPIRLVKPPPGCKVISGVKVLKLPTLKAGSIVKIDKLGKANIIQSDFKPTSNTQAGVSVISALTKPVSVDGLQSSTHHVTKGCVNAAKKTSSASDITFKKTIVNGKTILIPVQKAQVVKNHKATVTTIRTIPVGSVVRSTSHNVPHLVKSKSFSLETIATGHALDQQSSVQPISKPNPVSSSGMKLTLTKSSTQDCNPPCLNLGSMFVESAEKAVDSDFETPPASPYSVVVSDTNKQVSNLLKSDNHSISSQAPSSRFYRKKIDAINGSSPLYDHLKRTTSSIPTIDLTQANDRPTTEKSILFGSSALSRTLSLPSMAKHPGEELVAEDEKEEESGMQNAQTYAEYMPSKLQIGLPHPDSVVETSSLASIIPPDVHYRLCIPKEAIDFCRLSALQLECVTYASQKHNTFLRSGERAGYLIGDGAGVGKGRSVAGIIYENYLIGRKRALWFSVSNDLRYDAERDLRDIGAKHIKVYPLNKFKYGKITARNNGAVKKGVIFSTYSSLIGESHSQAKYHTRLKQILHWCGEDFDGVIIFDECHKAKNLVPSGAGKSTKTGITVVELQKQLPNARVVYASATGASEPRNMAYMSRLGLWGPGTPFHDFMDFIQAVERRGVGAMELVAMDMKLRGSYIARQLSFYGVSFKINEVALDPSFLTMYNKAVKLWMIAREAFQTAASMMEAEYHMKKSMWAMFWSAHQRFFKYLCISAKVKHTVSLVREAVKHGKCVVIGMQSTGEASTIDQLEKAGGELDDFVSTAKAVLENLIDRHFPAPDRKRVTALFGKDFYKQSSTEQEKETSQKRKLPVNGKSIPPSKRLRRGSESSGDGATSTSESADEEDLSSDDDNLSLASLDSTCTDEDIGKIFGDASDSEDNESPVKKKTKLRKKSSSSSKEEDSDDPGLTLESLKKVDEKADLLTSIDALSGTLTSSLPGMGPVERAQALKRELLNRLELLGPLLPNNMLDELIDALGGPENVAEMTGRKGRVIATDAGNVEYQSRAEIDVPVELLNIKEKQRFMDGEKNVAIISEAASSGISLQADKRARNQRRRVHVTLELPWSADRAIQQFGRTHRSNQVNAPEYVFLITELAGEQRFASIVAKRLESLGALTHGDRRATETRDLSKYNYDNKYGRKALDSVMKAIAGYDAPLVSPPSSYKGHFFKDIRQSLLGVGLITREADQAQYQLDKGLSLCDSRVEVSDDFDQSEGFEGFPLDLHMMTLYLLYYDYADYNNIFKFMNRMLGMEVDRQNALFQFFSDTMQAIIMEAKRQGQYDQGIVDVGAGSNNVERVKCRDFPVASGGTASLHTVRVERGTSWEEGLKICKESSVGENSGFYVTFQKKNGKHMVMLAIEYKSRRHRAPSLFLIYRPNTGKQTRRETLEDIKKKYRRCSEEEAEQWWTRHHLASLEQCTHEFWQGVCNRGGIASCHVGKRRCTYHVLSGSVLGVWRTVEYVLSVEGGNKYKMQIVRLRTSDGGKLVGLLIPSTCTASLIAALSSENDLSDQSQNATSLSVSRDSYDAVSDDSDDYEDVEEIEPDEMLSSVLFSKRQFSWTT